MNPVYGVEMSFLAPKKRLIEDRCNGVDDVVSAFVNGMLSRHVASSYRYIRGMHFRCRFRRLEEIIQGAIE